MADNTANFKLYKVDPIIDGNSTFNIQTMLNDNWDKIDKEVIAKFLEAKGYADEKISASEKILQSQITSNGKSFTVISSSFTASGNGISNIPIGHSNYNPVEDLLRANLGNELLIKDVNYKVNSDNMSIDLLDWTLNKDEVIYFETIKKSNTPLTTSDGTLLQDETVGEVKLDRALKDKLNSKAEKKEVSELGERVAACLADYTLQVPYGGTTTGTANIYAISLPITALTMGMAVSVKFNLDSTGASTLNWNGKGAKGIKKANGTDVTNLKATGIYTLRYDGTNFILQGEGGSGNATASDLLSGKTASTDAGDIVGTMINKVGSGTIITPSTIDQAIPNGFFGGVVGDGKVKGDANLVASNIANGKTIFGIAGTSVGKKAILNSGFGAASFSPSSSGTDYTVTVNSLDFTPQLVVGNFQAHINCGFAESSGDFVISIVGNVLNLRATSVSLAFNVTVKSVSLTSNGCTIVLTSKYTMGSNSCDCSFNNLTLIG